MSATYTKFFIGLCCVAAAVAGGYMVFGGNGDTEQETVPVTRGTLVREVTVPGTVISDQRIDMAFERSGTISRFPVSVGDSVTEDALLAQLEQDEVNAQLSEARANLQKQQAQLAELQRGTRQEAVDVDRTTVANAKRDLADARQNLMVIKEENNTALRNTYIDALNTARDLITKAKTALIDLTSIQYAHFSGQGGDETRVSDAKSRAMRAMFDVADAGTWNVNSVSGADNGVFGELQSATVDTHTYAQIDTLLAESVTALGMVHDALTVVPVVSGFTKSQEETLASQRNTISEALTMLSTKRQAITTQKRQRESALTQAQQRVNTAENTLRRARKELELSGASTTPETLAVQRAAVRAARAKVTQLEARLGKMELTAPFAGTVTAKTAEEGETVSAGQKVLTLLTTENPEVEAYISDLDIATVEPGDTGTMDIDAYDGTQEMPVRVQRVNPAAETIDGVSVYEVTLTFEGARVDLKLGMSGEVRITTQKKTDVLTVPRAAVFERGGDTFVRARKREGEPFEEVNVSLGMRGSGGRVEITDGLSSEYAVVLAP